MVDSGFDYTANKQGLLARFPCNSAFFCSVAPLS